MQSVQHIVYMVQENRSFDHYFGQLGQYRAANNFGPASDIDGLPATAGTLPTTAPLFILSIWQQPAWTNSVTTGWRATST